MENPVQVDSPTSEAVQPADWLSRLLLSLAPRLPASIRRFIERLTGAGDTALMARRFVVVFIIQVISYGLSYLSYIFLAHWVGQTGVGYYAYVTNWYLLLTTFGSLGLDVAALKFIPEYITEKRWSMLRGFLQTSNRVIFIASTVLTVLAVGYFLAFPPSDISTAIFLITIWGMPFHALIYYYQARLRGMGFVSLAFVPLDIGRSALIIAVAFICAEILHFDLDATIIATLLIPIGIVLVVQLYITHHYRERFGAGAQPERESRMWFKVSAPMLTMRGAGDIGKRFSIFIIGASLSASMVGLYAVADRTSILMTFILNAALSIFAPMISPLVKQGDHRKLQHLVTSITQWTFWGSVVIALGMLVFSRLILSFFGEEFEAAQTALILICIGQVFNALTGPVGYLLNLGGHEHLSMYIYVGNMIFIMILNLILIPRFGINGAAVANMLGTIAINLAAYIAVLKVMHINALPFSLGRKQA